jgi:hypothetical protein
MRSKLTIAVVLLLGLFAVGCTKTDTPATTKESSAVPKAAASDVEIKPTISLSRERIPQNGWLKMYGKGFTPKGTVLSHLRRPDGTEFREVSLLADAHGEFEHDIDTLLLQRGVHDLWVLDSASGLTSNFAHFTATDDPGPSERPIAPNY